MGYPTEEVAEAIKYAYAEAAADLVRLTQEAMRESGSFGETVCQLQRGEIGAFDALERQGFPIRDLLSKLNRGV